MTINPEAFRQYQFEEIHQSYDAKDAILYALGLGLGRDVNKEDELDYLLETQLKILPSFSVTMATPGQWIKDPIFGVNFTKLVHGAQKTIFHNPLKPSARVKATPKISALYDRGEGRGAVCIVERDIIDADDDTHYSTVQQSLLLRGDGGYGGTPAPKTQRVKMPDRDCDLKVSVPTSVRTALIYRLSGDWNPLHANPQIAKQAGFSRPILHGLASYGIAAWAIMKTTNCDLLDLSCRFSGIVYPGDQLDFLIWNEGDHFTFEAYVGERRVLDQGKASKNNGE